MYTGEGSGAPLQCSCLENPMDRGAWQAAVHGVAKSWPRLSDFSFIFHFHALEKEIAAHPSVLAWRIPGLGEPGGLPSVGSHRVGHDWSDLAAVAAAALIYKTANLGALKGKNKHELPVFWLYSKESWMTKPLFLGRFHWCFVPEVRRYLASKELPFKVLLILNNAPGYPELHQFSPEGTEHRYNIYNSASSLKDL